MRSLSIFIVGAAGDVARGTTVVDVQERSEFKHA